jgi:hypothetical protein
MPINSNTSIIPDATFLPNFLFPFLRITLLGALAIYDFGSIDQRAFSPIFLGVFSACRNVFTRGQSDEYTTLFHIDVGVTILLKH